MTSKTMVYISCADSKEIQAFELDIASGELSLQQTLALEGGPQPIYLRPDSRMLYAGTRPDCLLHALAIEPKTGQLTNMGAATATGNPTYVATDHAQRVLFSTSFGGSSVTVCPVDAAGVPQTAQQVLIELPNAHAAVMDQANRFVLVPMLGADAIRVYTLDAKAAQPLTEAHTLKVRTGSGPRHLRFNRAGDRVYSVNERDGTLDVFDYQASNGMLALRQSVNFLPENFPLKAWAAEVRLTPDGRYLYATDRHAHCVAAYRIEPDSGELSFIARYACELQPRGMNIDPSGRWLLVAGELSSHVSVYSIEAETGYLDMVHRAATGANPVGIEIGVLPMA